MPKDLGIVGSAIAAQVYSDPYVVRVDNLSTSQSVASWFENTWGPSGGFKSGAQNQTVDWYGNWTQAETQLGTLPGLNEASPKITIGPFAADVINQFVVDQYILIYNAPSMFYNISGANIGIWKVLYVDTVTNRIMIDYNSQLPNYRGTPGGVSYWNYGIFGDYNSPRLINAGFQPFVNLASPIRLTTQYSRSYTTPTKVISVIDEQRFTMPFVSNYETAATVYGDASNPVSLLPYSYVTRDTDVAARSPTGLVAKVVFDGSGSTTGNVHIDYPSFVEVTNTSAAIMITPSTIYNGNTTANLFSNSSTLAISSTTDNLKLQPGGFSIQRYDSHGLYDPSQPYLFANTSVLQFGTSGKTASIQAGGGIQNINDLNIGTPGISDVYINDYSITITSGGNQTKIEPGSATFGGSIAIAGGLQDSLGSFGNAGQFLSSDGVNAVWATSSFDYAADQNFGGNVTISGKLSPTLIDVLDADSNELRISGDVTTYVANTLEQLIISANSFVMLSNDAISNAVIINSTSFNIGNNSVNSTINSTSFTGTANNSLYLGGYAAEQYAFANTVVSVNVNSDYTWANVHTFTHQVIFSNTITANTSNGTLGQILTSNSTGVYWSDKYTVGSLPPDYPNHGDVWYYTDMEKLFMWINDGVSDYWYDFLPPSS